MREAVQQVSAGVADLFAVNLWAAAEGDLADLVHALGVVTSQVSALQALAVRELAGRNWPRRQGAVSTVAWLRESSRMTPSAAMRLVGLGETLAERPALLEAVRSGELSAEQAVAVGKALSGLAKAVGEVPLPAVGSDVAGSDVAGSDVAGPDVAGFDVAGFDVAGSDVAGSDVAGSDVAGSDVAGFDVAGFDVAGSEAAEGGAAGSGGDGVVPPTDSEIVAGCERALIGFGAQFHAGDLARLGDRVLQIVAPDVGEAVLGRKVARDERNAHESRSLTLSPDGTGRTIIRGSVDAHDAAVITTVLESLCQPRVAGAGGLDERTPGQRRADALAEVFRLALRTEELPSHGGAVPQVSVHLDFDILAGIVRGGSMHTGAGMSAGQARRWACDAGLIPMVLNTAGAVLDVGRQRRLFTGGLRRALEARDHGCAFPGCDRAPKWCEGHHIASWWSGGKTCLSNGVLLCGAHHRLIHMSEWRIAIATDGLPDFIPPPHVDLLRRPRRNASHLRF